MSKRSLEPGRHTASIVGTTPRRWCALRPRLVDLELRMARKVILDVDPGIDDALAVALALFDPGLEVVAVTATGGNVAAQQATINVQTIVELLDPARLPRLGAAPLDMRRLGRRPADSRRRRLGQRRLSGRRVAQHAPGGKSALR